MLLDLLLAIAVAPLLVLAICWSGWIVLVGGDWVVARMKGRIYRRRLDRATNLSALDELSLANRLWEVDWLYRHSWKHSYWNKERLHDRFRELQEQLELQQLSGEAHRLWQQDRTDAASRYDRRL